MPKGGPQVTHRILSFKRHLARPVAYFHTAFNVIYFFIYFLYTCFIDNLPVSYDLRSVLAMWDLKLINYNTNIILLCRVCQSPNSKSSDLILISSGHRNNDDNVDLCKCKAANFLLLWRQVKHTPPSWSRAEVHLLRCAPLCLSGHCSGGYRAISAAARPRHHVPLRTFRVPVRTGQNKEALKSYGRVQPATGVPPSAPGRGKIRREVGGFKRGGENEDAAAEI